MESVRAERALIPKNQAHLQYVIFDEKRRLTIISPLLLFIQD